MCLLTRLFSTLYTENHSLFHQITTICNKYCSSSITASMLEPPKYCKGALDIGLKHYSYNFFFQGSNKYIFFLALETLVKLRFLVYPFPKPIFISQGPRQYKTDVWGGALLHWILLGGLFRSFFTYSISMALIYTSNSPKSQPHPSLVIRE